METPSLSCNTGKEGKTEHNVRPKTSTTSECIHLTSHTHSTKENVRVALFAVTDRNLKAPHCEVRRRRFSAALHLKFDMYCIASHAKRCFRPPRANHGPRTKPCRVSTKLSNWLLLPRLWRSRIPASHPIKSRNRRTCVRGTFNHGHREREAEVSKEVHKFHEQQHVHNQLVVIIL
jgi:hypothetical protein